MKTFEESKDEIFFGEFAPYGEDCLEQKEEAKKYLLMWKENLIRKLKAELHNYELKDEHWGERPAYVNEFFCMHAHLYLKIYFKKLPYELG